MSCGIFSLFSAAFFNFNFYIVLFVCCLFIVYCGCCFVCLFVCCCCWGLQCLCKEYESMADTKMDRNFEYIVASRFGILYKEEENVADVDLCRMNCLFASFGNLDTERGLTVSVRPA